MLTKNQIIVALPHLKLAELQAVHAVTASLLGAATGLSAPVANPLAEPIFNAISKALGHSMAYRSLPPALSKQFDERLVGLVKFFGNFFPNWNVNKTQRAAFLYFMMSLLKSEVAARGLTPTYKIMIQSLGQMPVAFDLEFPGYRRSGLGQLILDKFK